MNFRGPKNPLGVHLGIHLPESRAANQQQSEEPNMTLSFAPDVIEQWPLDRLKPYARNAKTAKAVDGPATVISQPASG